MNPSFWYCCGWIFLCLPWLCWAEFRRGNLRTFVDCVGVDTNLTSVLDIDLFGGNVTPEEVATLEFGIRSTYNGYTSTCDPFFRQVTGVKAEFVTTEAPRNLQSSFGFNTLNCTTNSTALLGSNSTNSSNAANCTPVMQRRDRKPLTFFFRVTFQCRGCPSDTTLFDDGFRRHLGSGFQRNIQAITGKQDPNCVCPADQIEQQKEFRAPTSQEFTQLYNDTINTFVARGDLVNIESVRDIVTEGDLRCDTDDDCETRTCASDRWDDEGQKVNVCCPSRFASTRITGFGEYCHSIIPDGFKCPDNDLCESGICIDGICRASRRDAGKSCAEDDDCITGDCGADRWGDEVSKQDICCPARFASTRITGFGDYCHDIIQDGDPCPDTNGLCQSGLCIGGVCTRIRVSVGFSCAEDDDCQTDECASDRWGDEANKQDVCCPYRFGSMRITGFGNYCHGIIPTGNACPSDQHGMCKSGLCQDGICAIASTTQGFVQAGGSCTENSICFSNNCIGGVCRENKLQVGEGCQENEDCQTGRCAYDRWNDENNKVNVCCPFGSSSFFGNDPGQGSYCNSIIRTGDSCPENSMCESGLCIIGICQAEKVSNFQSCDDGADCLSGTCAYDLWNNEANKRNICCPFGDTWFRDFGSYCDGLIPNGQQCPDENSMCESRVCIAGQCRESRVIEGTICEDGSDCRSGSCALGQYGDTDNQQKICCTAGLGDSWIRDVGTFCNGIIPAGLSCPEDDPDLCRSGTCENGVCAKLQDSGQPCSNNNECPSRACALDRWNEANEANICCPGESRWYQGQYYCEGIVPTGGGCFRDSLCESGSCLDNVCVVLALPGTTCTEDVDCQSRTCAFDRWGSETSKQSICCKSLFSSDTITGFGEYCHEIVPTGGVCPSNGLCESGICINGKCQEVRLPASDECVEDDDCVTQTCALSIWNNVNSAKVCCPSRFASDRIADTGEFCHQIINDGGACPSNELCKSGICIDGVCQQERKPLLSLCDEDDDCVSLTCASDRWNDESRKVNVCCPGRFKSDRITDFGDYCHEIIESGNSCPSNGLCVSGICIDGVCVEVRLDAGQGCSEDDDCISLECAYDRWGSEANKRNICCPFRFGSERVPDFGFYCNEIIDAGSPCPENAHGLCKSGSCVGGICA